MQHLFLNLGALLERLEPANFLLDKAREGS